MKYLVLFVVILAACSASPVEPAPEIPSPNAYRMYFVGAVETVVVKAHSCSATVDYSEWGNSKTPILVVVCRNIIGYEHNSAIAKDSPWFPIYSGAIFEGVVEGYVKLP